MLEKNKMTPVNSFEIKACALIVQIDGQPSAINLRELRDRSEHCSAESIYHHFCETQLRPTFDDPEFTNDFATWAYRVIRDDILAERLGIIDPGASGSVEELRAALHDTIDDRLAEIDHISMAEPDHGFYFMRSSMLCFDTEMTLDKPEDIMWALRRMTRPSIYYNFIETRTKIGNRNSDIFSWLRTGGTVGESLADAFERVDFQHYTLRALRQELLHRAHRILGERATEV
jgi:hypothetical protein